MRHIGGQEGRVCKGCNEVTHTNREHLKEGEKIRVPSQRCGDCLELMKIGVVLLSVQDGTEEDDSPYRTGGFVVIKDEAIERMVNPPELAAQIIKQRMCFVPDEAWAALGLPPPGEEFDNRESEDDSTDPVHEA
jgi:hypothetical protein